MTVRLVFCMPLSRDTVLGSVLAGRESSLSRLGVARVFPRERFIFLKYPQPYSHRYRENQ
jgi:hypothetical protein